MDVHRSGAGAEGSPWERREDLGFWRALLRTVGAIAVTPRRAFAALRERGGLRDPLTFALVVALLAGLLDEVVEVATQLLSGLGEGEGLEQFFAIEIAGRSFTWLPISIVSLAGCLVGLVIGTPVFLLVFSAVLFAWSGLLHLSLLAVGGLRSSPSGFQGTFRGTCFSQVGLLAGMLPAVGEPAALLWVGGLQVAAFMRFHRARWPRALAAVLLPLSLLGALALAGLLLGSGEGGAPMRPAAPGPVR